MKLDPGGESLDALALRAREGDRTALEALVRGVQDPMYRLALRMLGNPEDAREATQEILIVIVTQLSTFRGESALTTWAYRIASRHLLKERRRRGRRFSFESLAEDDLGKPPNAIEPETLARAEARLLEEEVFVGCTQAMLRALDAKLRVAFVLGAICELESADAARVLEISEAAFRKRLSRARETLDAFLTKQCGVANPENTCRCAHQVNWNVKHGRVNPERLYYALAGAKTTLEAFRAMGEIHRVRRSLELYRAQPKFAPTEDFAAHMREMIASAQVLGVS